jgi:hypothetical protein
MAVELPTVADVRAVYTTAQTNEQIQAAINDAAMLVAACVIPLDADRQAAIIKYVAADLLVTTMASAGKGMLTSRSLGDASESWSLGSSVSTMGKSAYWPRALMLDPNGCLARLGGRTASFEKV